MKLCQRIWQIGALHGRDRTDVDQHAGRLAQRCRAQIVIKPQQLLRLQKYLVPHFVEMGRASFPVENLEPELGFQALDLRAHSGLSQADPVAGSGESAFPRHSNECLQFFDHSQILIVFLRNIY